MAEPRHVPPAPGAFVDPNLEAIERAVDRFTFPISKRDMLESLDDSETVVVDGRNTEVRTLVKDLNDDFFDSVEEFRDALRTHYPHFDPELTTSAEERESPIFSDVTQDLEQTGPKIG